MAGKTVNWETGKVDDDVGFVNRLPRETFGRETIGGISVGSESGDGGLSNVAKRSETRAGGLDDLGSVPAGDGFGDGAAAGVTDANKNDTEFFARDHESIVAQRSKVSAEHAEEK